MDTYWSKYNFKINKISEKMVKFNSKNVLIFDNDGQRIATSNEVVA